MISSSQPQSLPAELLLLNAILLDEVLDGLGLMAVDPAGEGGEEELELERVGHVPAFIGSSEGVTQVVRSRLDPSTAYYSDSTVKPADIAG